MVRVDVPSAAVFLVTTYLIEENRQLFDTLDETEWIVHTSVRKGRFCVNPALSRVRVLTSIQVPFLSFPKWSVQMSEHFVPFLEMDCRYLYQVNYETELLNVLRQARFIRDISDIIEGNSRDVFRAEYSDANPLEFIVKELGVDTIASGGSFPWVYRGIAHFVIEGVHLYITCEDMFPCDDNLFSMCSICSTNHIPREIG